MPSPILFDPGGSKHVAKPPSRTKRSNPVAGGALLHNRIDHQLPAGEIGYARLTHDPARSAPLGRLSSGPD
ncbi:MAG: hypothetical protein IPM15_07760 [Betaproteobacteria bacterium]|nr:hypothetical protein [Betaproteobacteria bacterium]